MWLCPVRILHTADWHLADRLKQIDRTKDLERAVEQIADYCEQHDVDVLVIAGDLFSELARLEALQSSLAHLSQTFRRFLMRSGTIVAIAGNHDNDIYCETLRRAFQLAAPNAARHGDVLPAGRVYLTTQPSHFRLCDSQGMPLQIACLPYPTASRYALNQSESTCTSFDQRRGMLRDSFVGHLRTIRQQLDWRQPSLLIAHINTVSPRPCALFHHPLGDDILVDDEMMSADWNYVALGHLHGPGKVRGRAHVRYSGSIERLSIAEREQPKGVVLVQIEPGIRKPRIELLPLKATPFYDVRIDQPRRDLPRLRERYVDAATALTRCHIRYDPGTDDLHAILAEVSRIFPRCYERTWSEKGSRNLWAPSALNDRTPTASGDRTDPLSENRAPTPHASAPQLDISGSPRQLVLSYLDSQLANDADRDAIVALVQQLMEESD